MSSFEPQRDTRQPPRGSLAKHPLALTLAAAMVMLGGAAEIALAKPPPTKVDAEPSVKTNGRHVVTGRSRPSTPSRPPTRSTPPTPSVQPRDNSGTRGSGTRGRVDRSPRGPRSDREVYRHNRRETDVGRHTRQERRDTRVRVGTGSGTYTRAHANRGNHRYSPPRHRRGYRDGYRYGGYEHRYGRYGYGTSANLGWRSYTPFYCNFYGSFFAWSPHLAWYSWPGYHRSAYPSRAYYYPREVDRAVGYSREAPGALDLDVSPEKAQIFIDGEYVGIADEFDGFPTYLFLDPGAYEVAIYHPGHETIFRQYSIYPGQVIDVEDRMRSGEALHPDDRGPKSTKNRDERIRRNREREDETRARRDQAQRRADERIAAGDAKAEEWEARAAAETEASVGRLLLDIWPGDAAIYLDGHFLGTGEEVSGMSAGLVIEAGKHQLEVVRPDHLSRDISLNVEAGERLDLVIELEPDS